MVNRVLRVLSVEDSERDAALLSRHLTRAGFAPTCKRVETSAGMRAALESQEWDVILCDYSLPHFNSLAALALLKEMDLDIPFIIISGTIGESVAVEAMRAGAHDYLMKDNLVRLAQTIERELHDADNRRARQKAETELRQSEAQYRCLIDTAHEGIWIADANAQITYANQRLAEMLGYTVEEIIGRPSLAFFDEDTQGKMKLKWQSRLQGSEGQYDLRLQRRDGSALWVILSATPIRDEQGEVTGALVMLTDITQRKRAEELVRLQATALESADNAILISGRDGNITWVNPAFTALTGYAPEEVLGRNPRLLKSGRHEPAFYESMWRTLLSGQVWHGEMVNLRKDGSAYFEEQTITPVLHETGEITNFIAIKQDITERKRAERLKAQLTTQIENQRQRLDNIVASVPGVVWEAWVEPDAATQRINFVSDYVETMLGYSKEEWLSMPNFWLSNVGLDDRERTALNAAQDFAGGQVSNTREFRWVARDGHVLWVQSNSAVITDDDGRPVGLRGVTLDITDRKRLEEQLRQAHKMEAMGTLAGGIAHDFNNILGAIMGYSELAKMEVPEDGPAHVHLDQVLSASGRAANLVRQILTFSRQEEPDRAAFQLQPIVDETLKLLQASLPSTVAIRQNIDLATPLLMGDSTQIQQMVMNLCVNAGQAMKERGGVLEISLESIDIDSALASANPELKETTYIRLTVQDTGCGMDHSTQERIFDPFFTTKPPGEGTGLGLAVVHGVVKNHGGAITVSSEPGIGSTFHVYLPVYYGPSSVAGPKSISLPQGNGEHILFVGDEESLVLLARPMLERLGYRVTTLTDTVEALAAFRSRPEDFDMVITDQTMPQISGCDLARALLEIRPQLPVILATGYSTVNAEEAKALGIREFLHKPITMRVLAEAIQRALAPKQKGINQ